jgi:ribose 5-phosphate isomerase A
MDLKMAAARAALEQVESGMVLGLGSGSTTAYFVEMLADKLREGKLHDICGVPTSRATAEQAERLGIPLTNLDDHEWLDLAVDGADEVDPQLDLIKGLGGALLREKIVEVHARRLVIIVDDTKLVQRLGSKKPVPVEILPFGVGAHLRWLNSLGCRAELWRGENGSAEVSDNGNYFALCFFNADSGRGIPDVWGFADALDTHPGILEHGLFLNMASMVIVAGMHGVKILEKKA